MALLTYCCYLLVALTATAQARSALVLDEVYWHSAGLESNVLVRKWRGQARVDPIMLVDLTDLEAELTVKRFDSITKQAYIRVPVKLTDDKVLFALRAERSVKFATVSEVNASADPGSIYDALGFDWSQGEQVGYLRLGCTGTVNQVTGHLCVIDDLVQRMRSRQFAPLRRVLLTAQLRLPNSQLAVMDYRLSLHSSGQAELEDYSVSSRTDSADGIATLLACQQAIELTPYKSVRIANGTCSVMIYVQKPGLVYLVEEPICFDTESSDSAVTIFSDVNDVNRWYLSLKMLSVIGNQSQRLLAEIAANIGLSVDHLNWMRLWRVRRDVPSFLAKQFRVGQLRMPAKVDAAGATSGEVEIHCRHEAVCRYLKAKIDANPVNFWRHIRWQPTYLAELYSQKSTKRTQCLHSPAGARFAASALTAGMLSSAGVANSAESTAWEAACSYRSSVCRLESEGERKFVIFQQRQSASVGFDRPWSDYVKGFGDGNNFWIGLNALHLLTTVRHSNSATLRIDMTFWNGTRRLIEYASFRVAGPEANFSMNYDLMLAERSQVAFDSLHESRGKGFSTYDRDNDGDPGSCSLAWGKGGWWFGACYKFHPNGWYPTIGENQDWRYMKWVSNTEIVTLRNVKMMIQL